ncbi:MAG TPA: hypothetical protein DEB62_11060 [Vibrio sp.]|nr:hypothetical protein [Vibrio sp.]
MFKDRLRTDSVDLFEGIDEESIVSGSNDRILCSDLVNAKSQGRTELQFRDTLKYNQFVYAVRCELLLG